ncbi:MAG: nickel pincer cofactor biosynthesis protein LarC [Candidatus Omnitrophota bacterium]|nr:MAG: nickel pincer cofactor biosynthesis protein LarC [Candidatus Omnitrophota bacterium]
MRIGYFEIFNGCAGNIFVGSLIDAGLPLEELESHIEKIPLKNYKIQIERVKRKVNFSHSVSGTLFRVIPEKGKWDETVPYLRILELIDESRLSQGQKEKIKEIFRILADAESKVHGEPLEKLHFHKIGQVDAIIEISSVVIGLELLGIEKVYFSKIGISNPSNATIEILKGLPVIMRNTPYEITTPTGAAIVKGFYQGYNAFPEFVLEKVGYGAGEREEPSPNMLKFFIGLSKDSERIVVIETTIDDQPPELFEVIFDRLFENGAIDVSITHAHGKKGRPVFNLKILAPEYSFEKIIKTIFSETTTLGIRYRVENRILLEREIKELETKFGKIPVKIAYFGGERVNISPEYEICKKISNEKKIPLKEVYLEIYKNIQKI